MSKPVIGLALGSGAARGFSHIGVIEALGEEGIRPDVIAGCSIGAFVGAAYVADQLDEMHRWADVLTWREVAGHLDISVTGGGLFDSEVIEQLMTVLGIGGNIEDLDRPFATVATDYLTGREEWHRRGPIRKAVRASMSLPSVLTPTMIGDDWFVDGGLVNPVPVSACRALGATIVIAVNLNSDLVARPKPPARVEPSKDGHEEMIEQLTSVLPASWRGGVTQPVNEFLKPRPAKPGYFEVLSNSINIMQDQITRSRLAGEPPHVMITPRLTAMGPFDFEHAKHAIAEGRDRARYAIPEIKRYLPVLDSASG